MITLNDKNFIKRLPKQIYIENNLSDFRTTTEINYIIKIIRKT